MNVCHSLCPRYAVKKIWRQSMYDLGYKKCLRCEVFVEPKYRSCPCCGGPLRSRSKSKSAVAAKYVGIGI